MKTLTKGEEQIMQILWDLEKAFVNEIIKSMPEPKPAYNTVSTIIRILETKEFVSHEAFGKSHRYFPIVSKQEYSERSLIKLVSNYFDNSYSSLVSFFAEKEKVSVEELEEMQSLIEEQIKKQKK